MLGFADTVLVTSCSSLLCEAAEGDFWVMMDEEEPCALPVCLRVRWDCVGEWSVDGGLEALLGLPCPRCWLRRGTGCPLGQHTRVGSSWEQGHRAGGTGRMGLSASSCCWQLHSPQSSAGGTGCAGGVEQSRVLAQLPSQLSPALAAGI